MTPEERAAVVVSVWEVARDQGYDAIDLKTRIARAIRDAVTEAVAGEREVCLQAIDEEVEYFRRIMDGDASIIAYSMEKLLAAIRSRWEGEGEGET